MIIIPARITEDFIRNHPELTFVYSTDLRGKGGLGMQWFMAGPPNSFPVPTLIKFCANPEYFRDIMHRPDSDILNAIDKYILHIPKSNPIIVPPKIGLGCARMLEYCPKTYKYLRDKLDRIMSKDVKIDYNHQYGN